MHRGLGHCASLWPCSWQRSHASSLRQPCCICASFPHEWRTLTALDTLTHRMACCVALFCTLGMGTNLSRTTYSNFCTLSLRFGAIQIHSWRKPSRVRSDDDSIQISLIRFFTQRPCLDLRCQALTYLRSGLAWTSAARPLLTYLLRAAMHRGDVSDRSDLLFCFCKPNSWPIFKGRN